VKEAFFEAMKKVLNDRNLKQKLKRFKSKNLSKIGEDWSDPIERQRWIVDDYLHGTKIDDVKKYSQAVKKIKVSKIRALAKKYFNQNRIQLVWVK
jgi:predicted Zn-dependent peptidase